MKLCNISEQDVSGQSTSRETMSTQRVKAPYNFGWACLRGESSLTKAAGDKKKIAVFKPLSKNELWANIFYIITGIQSIDVLIKGGEYWVKVPTAHHLLVPHEVDSHGTNIIHQKFVMWTEMLNYLEAGQSRRTTLKEHPHQQTLEFYQRQKKWNPFLNIGIFFKTLLNCC